MKARMLPPDEKDRNKKRIFEILNDDGLYMGSVCLKCIDAASNWAELTVSVEDRALGCGYAWFGLKEVLGIAFHELALESVYWCVPAKNSRAVRFFDKHGFNRLDGDIPESIRKTHDSSEELVWYAVLAGDDYENKALARGSAAGCRIIRIRTVPTVEAGQLSFFEAGQDIPFDIKRIYYISKVPEGMRRGFHAHKKLRQVLFCPYGEIQLILENSKVREEITLNDPSVGVVIDQPVWREMLWLKKDSVLCVAASDYYDPEDYIRSYDAFKAFVAQ